MHNPLTLPGNRLSKHERVFAGYQKRKLPMPVLALAGSESNGMGELEMAKEVAQYVRGGVAPGAGHWLPDESPDFLAARLVNFLREGAASPR